MVDVERVVLKPIDYRLDVEQDPDFINYIKKKLIGVTLHEELKIEVMMLGHPLPLFVEKTEPDGEVTITENTVLQITNEFMRVGGLYASIRSEHKMGQLPTLSETLDLLVGLLKDHEKRLDIISERFEHILERLEYLERKTKA